MSDSRNLLLTGRKKNKIFSFLTAAFSEIRSVVDILFATPLRDWQVFDLKSFLKLLAGRSHEILSPITAAFTILGGIPFIAKLFVKSEQNN